MEKVVDSLAWEYGNKRITMRKKGVKVGEQKRVATNRELKLVLSSKVIEDYPWLQEFLENNPTIMKKELKESYPEHVNFFENMFLLITKQASEEWESDSEHPIDQLLGEERIPCELCGHKIKYLCAIRNKFNNNKLTIGSECVKHFGIDLGKSMSQLIKDMHKTKRLNRLNNIFPGINRLIDFWDETINKYSIIIPYKLEKPYLQLGKEIKNIFENYLEKGNPEFETVSEKLSDLIKQQKVLLKDIDKYVSKNKTVKFIPTKEVAEWLKRKGGTTSLQCLQWLKEDGVVSWRTAFRIEERSFMNSIAADLKNCLKRIGIKYKNITSHNNKNGYVITTQKFPNIQLFLPHKDFFLKHWGVITNTETEKIDTPLDLKNVIEISKIFGERSLILIMNQLEKLSVPGIKFDGYDLDLKQLILIDKKTNEYLIFTLNQVAEDCKAIALGIEKESSKAFKAYLDTQTSKKYSKAEYKDKQEIEKQFGM